jgi:hypothetical protein
MSDPRLAPTLEEANSGRAFARKWERRFQFAKHGPALMRRWPKPGTPSVGVVGGGAGIATSNPGVGGTAAIVTGILALLQEYAADSDWDNRHRYHQLRRQAYESIAAEIEQQTAKNEAIPNRLINQWNDRLAMLRNWIYEDESTWVTKRSAER